mgnify:CR=1 FL=1
MDVLLTVLGIVVIVAGLMDMFHTLLHPSGQGRLSRLVLSTVWRGSKVTGHRAGSAVGPAASRRATASAVRFSSALSEKWAPSVQQPDSGADA